MLPIEYYPRAVPIARRFVAACDAVYKNGYVSRHALTELADEQNRLPTYKTEPEALAAAQRLATGRLFAERHDASL